MAPSTLPDGTYQLQFGPSPPLRKFIRPSLGMKAVCVPGAGADGRLVQAPTDREYRRRRALFVWAEMEKIRTLGVFVWVSVCSCIFKVHTCENKGSLVEITIKHWGKKMQLIHNKNGTRLLHSIIFLAKCCDFHSAKVYLVQLFTQLIYVWLPATALKYHMIECIALWQTCA